MPITDARKLELADRGLDVCVDDADSVDDDHLSLVAWCGSWAGARTTGIRLVPAP
jgi:hypothetical protein